MYLEKQAAAGTSKNRLWSLVLSPGEGGSPGSLLSGEGARPGWRRSGLAVVSGDGEPKQDLGLDGGVHGQERLLPGRR